MDGETKTLILGLFVDLPQPQQDLITLEIHSGIMAASRDFSSAPFYPQGEKEIGIAFKAHRTRGNNQARERKKGAPLVIESVSKC